jgi:hypothetical protein
MDEKEHNKLIGYAVLAIIAYFILQALVPYLIWGVIGLVHLPRIPKTQIKGNLWPIILPTSVFSCR